MGIFDLFKPNVEKMERNKDVEGLVQIMRHKKGSIKEQAVMALDKIGWKPSNLIEKIHYAIAKGEEDEKDVCIQTLIMLSNGINQDNKEQVSTLADLIIKLIEVEESNASYGCAQLCFGMLCLADNDRDGAIKSFELALQHGSTKWYSEEVRKFSHNIAQAKKK